MGLRQKMDKLEKNFEVLRSEIGIDVKRLINTISDTDSDCQIDGNDNGNENEYDDDKIGLEVSDLKIADCDSETTDDEAQEIELPIVPPPIEFRDHDELKACFKYHIELEMSKMLRPVKYMDSRPDVNGAFCFERK